MLPNQLYHLALELGTTTSMWSDQRSYSSKGSHEWEFIVWDTEEAISEIEILMGKWSHQKGKERKSILQMSNPSHFFWKENTLSIQTIKLPITIQDKRSKSRILYIWISQHTNQSRYLKSRTTGGASWGVPRATPVSQGVLFYSTGLGTYQHQNKLIFNLTNEKIAI